MLQYQVVPTTANRNTQFIVPVKVRARSYKFVKRIFLAENDSPALSTLGSQDFGQLSVNDYGVTQEVWTPVPSDEQAEE